MLPIDSTILTTYGKYGPYEATTTIISILMSKLSSCLATVLVNEKITASISAKPLVNVASYGRANILATPLLRNEIAIICIFCIE